MSTILRKLPVDRPLRLNRCRGVRTERLLVRVVVPGGRLTVYLSTASRRTPQSAGAQISPVLQAFFLERRAGRISCIGDALLDRAILLAADRLADTWSISKSSVIGAFFLGGRFLLGRPPPGTRGSRGKRGLEGD